MLHIMPGTLILVLQIRQSIHLVLQNVLSSSFLMFRITFDEISSTLSIQSGIKVDILDTCGAMIDSFILLYRQKMLFTHLAKTAHFCSFTELIFDIMNTQNNQSLEFE